MSAAAGRGPAAAIAGEQSDYQTTGSNIVHSIGAAIIAGAGHAGRGRWTSGAIYGTLVLSNTRKPPGADPLTGRAEAIARPATHGR